jgi:hypothetical protein
VGYKGAYMRTWKLQVCLLIVTIGVIVLGGEVYLRIKAGEWEKIYWPAKFEPSIGSIFVPGEFVQHTNHFDFWTKTKVNSLGWLDREPESLESSRDKLRVAFIGDSFVEACQVNIEDKAHVQLENMVNSGSYPK